MDEVKDRPPYVVGNDSNPEAIRKAVEGLRKMVAAGEEASKALEALERDGCYNRVVRWLQGDDNQTVRRSRFPRYEPISPDDLPMMAELRLELLRGQNSQYGGHPCREYPLALQGSRLVYRKSRVLELRPMEGGISIGVLRAGKNAVSWLSGSKTAYLITEKRKTVGATVARIRACEALEPLGGAIGQHLVVPDPKHRYDQNFSLSQKAKDLRSAAEQWLVEQGHVARMLEDVVRMLWIEGVMEG